MAAEAGVEVRDEDLSAFVEVDGAGVEGGGVVETREVGREEVDETGGGVVGFVDEVDD